MQNLRPEAPESEEDGMKTITISKGTFLDLIACKSKLEDIKVELEDTKYVHKRTLVDKLTQIVNSTRYQDKEAG